VIYYKVLSLNSLRKTDENHKKSIRKAKNPAEIQTGTSHTQ